MTEEKMKSHNCPFVLGNCQGTSCMAATGNSIDGWDCSIIQFTSLASQKLQNEITAKGEVK